MCVDMVAQGYEALKRNFFQLSVTFVNAVVKSILLFYRLIIFMVMEPSTDDVLEREQRFIEIFFAREHHEIVFAYCA